MTKLLTTLIVFGNVFCMVSCFKIQENSDTLEKLTSVKNHDRNEEKNDWGWPAPPAPQTLPSCLSPSEIVVADNINFTFYQTNRLFHIAAKTDYGYRRLAKMFLGRPPTDAEMDTMCFTKFYGNVFFKQGPILNTAFGLQLRDICGPVGVNPAITKCVSDLDGDPGVNPTTQKTFYLLKTDSKTYSISYICLNGVGDFQMRTMNGFVTPEQKRILKQTVAKYGFANAIKFAPCIIPPHTKPYPYPFQNYPIPNSLYGHS